MIYSNEAEQAVISAVLLGLVSPSETGLTEDHFGMGSHQALWRICLELDEKSIPPDMVTVGDRITDDHLADYMMELAEEGQGNAEVWPYCDIIREKWQRRVISRETVDLSQEAGEGDIAELLARADGITEKLESGNNNLAPDHKKALAEHLRQIDDRAHGKGVNGISTGSADIDQKTMGMMPTDLIIVAGRPGMGKSAFMLDLTAAACAEGPVFLFSLEMPRARLYDRLIASQGSVDYGNLLRGKMEHSEWAGLAAAMNHMQDWNLVVDDRSGLTPAQIRAGCRLYKKRHGSPAAIFVDYLQIMQAGKKQDNRTNEVSYISGQLKQIAKEFACPVVALSQLNRGVENRPNKRPGMSDLRESGAIEQDANVIIFLYRDEYYNEKTEFPGVAEFIIAKQRDGETGTITRSFIGRHQTFKDLYRGDV